MRRPNFIAAQAQSPSGLLGRFLAWIMSFETKAANRKTLELLEIQKKDSILEIGFGHGRTIQFAAAQAADGFVAGAESSMLAVEIAEKRNDQKIKNGQVDLRLMTDGRIPFSDATFDKAFAVHSIYFWSQAETMLREILRVLKTSGLLVLCFRDDSDFRKSFPSHIYHFRSREEVHELLSIAGFDEVRIISSGKKRGTGELHWAIAMKADRN